MSAGGEKIRLQVSTAIATDLPIQLLRKFMGLVTCKAHATQQVQSYVVGNFNAP
jgi:hypothetical protein